MILRDPAYACPCCGRAVISTELSNAIGQLQDLLGPEKTIVVHSGYRCTRHNATVKNASPHSRHLEGMAVDCHVEGMTMRDLEGEAEMIPAFYAGGIGVYDKHVHLDVRTTGPKRWTGVSA